MKQRVGLLLAGFALSAALAGITRAPEKKHSPASAHEKHEGFALVWADEFNIDGRPDPANWAFENGFKRNNEAQWYQPDNATVKDGMLVIEARQERIENPNHDPGSDNWRSKRRFAEYTSASLKTEGLHAWTYGRFELRAKIDIGPGLWPAWWTVGTARPWPGGGEIDMMEYYRGDILANACWKAPGGRWNQHWDTTKTPVADLAEDGDTDAWARQFHVWRMDWTPESIDLYIDDRLLNTIDLAETVNPDGSNPFHEPHHMLINLAIGGTNGGDPAASSFPKRYEIDYVRVYQKMSGQ
ncbi:MAG: glycoside hydrolase family 16 protein [Planctomycetota bacterium]